MPEIEQPLTPVGENAQVGAVEGLRQHTQPHAGGAAGLVVAPGGVDVGMDEQRLGTITTRGLTNNAGALGQLVITGGTGAFTGAFGDGTLTPTPTGSTVTLRITR